MKINGSHYYYAQHLILEGKLNNGDLLILKPEPQNRHDPNAVGVYCSKSNLMVG